MTETITPYDHLPRSFAERLARLGDPLPLFAIHARMAEKPREREGKWYARYVLYVDATYITQRLDHWFPGAWSTRAHSIPTAIPGEPGVAVVVEIALYDHQTGRVIRRSDIGQGKDWKQAATDGFKRAAMRFGIARELYVAEKLLYVHVASGEKYAKPMEDPIGVYVRKYHGLPRVPTYVHQDVEGERERPVAAPVVHAPAVQHPVQQPVQHPIERAADAKLAKQDGDVLHDGTGDPKVVGEPSCPECEGRMWDNRLTKRNPKAPDWKCRDRSCKGVYWPGERTGTEAREAPTEADEIPF